MQLLTKYVQEIPYLVYEIVIIKQTDKDVSILYLF